jgi:hypothetical protein
MIVTQVCHVLGMSGAFMRMADKVHLTAYNLFSVH